MIVTATPVLVLTTLLFYILIAILFTKNGLVESWVIAILILFVIGAGALLLWA